MRLALLILVFAVMVQIGAGQAAVPPHLAPEDLTAAVRFEEDRQAGELVTQAQEAIRRGDRTTAVTLLQELMDLHQSGLVRTATGYRSGLHEAWRVLRESPPEIISQYRRHSSQAAATEFEAAAARGEDRALVDVVLRYRFTEAGQAALLTLAQRRFDSARFSEAASLYERLIGEAFDRRQAARKSPTAVLAWMLSLHEAGKDGQALAVANEFASSLTEGPVSSAIVRLTGELRNAGGSGSDTPSTAEEPEIAQLLPGSISEWEQPIDGRPSLSGPRDTDMLQEFAVAGVAPYLQARPLEVVGGLAVRTADGVALLESANGEVKWRWPRVDRDPSQAATDQVAPFPERGRLGQLEHAIGDAVQAGLSADQKRIYLLTDRLPWQSNRGDAPLANVLTAIDAASGDVVWVRGERGDDFDDVYFRGAPAVDGDHLLVIGDRDTTTELFALDSASGELNWTVKLCAIAASPVRDDRRLAQGCRVQIASGTAFCPTGGGGLVAVDLFSRAVQWVYRYPREPVRADEIGKTSQIRPPRQLVWTDSWSAPYFRVAGRQIVFAGGESDRLGVLDAASGAVVWTIPREDAAFVACTSDAHVILVHPDSISAVRLDNGETDWIVPVDEPAGRGCVAGGHYLQPLLRGGVAAVRLTDGTITRTFSAADVRPRIVSEEEFGTSLIWRPVAWTWSSGHVVEQSLDGVRRLANLGESLESARTAFENAPDNDEPAVSYARLLHEAGDFERAAGTLLVRVRADGESTERKTLVPSALDAMFTGSWITGDTSSLSEFAPVLIERETDRLRFRICRLRSDLAGSSPTTIKDALDLLDLGAERCYLEREGGGGLVRLDRQVQSWLQEWLDEADDATRKAVEEEWGRAIEERIAQSGNLEAHRLLAALDHLAPAQRLRIKLPPRWSTTAEFVQCQLELGQLIASDDDRIAVGALLALADLYEAHSDYRQAAESWRRLKDRAGGQLPDGTSVAELMAAIPMESPLRQYLGTSALIAWPDGLPVVTSRPASSQDEALYAWCPEVVTDRGGLVDGIAVTVDRNGNDLRFGGGLWDRNWHLELPPSHGFGEIMRNEAYADLRRAWMFGHLLVLQVGGNVFGVAPLDRNGEANAELLWPAPDQPVSAGEFVAKSFVDPQTDAPLLSGFSERRLLLDKYWQPVGEVGPVRSGYFCVRRSGELIACETASGRPLWTRTGLSPAVEVFGDDESLVMIRHDNPQVSVLRAVDGGLASTVEWQDHDAHLLHLYGCRALMLQSTSNGTAPTCQLFFCDLTSGERLWSRTFPDNSTCFPADERHCGLLEPDGRLHFIDLATGEDAATQQVRRPAQLTGIRTMRDQESLFLMLSAPGDDPAVQGTVRPDGQSPNTGLRSFELNGPMHAFDRNTWELRWTRDVDDAVIRLDQPADVPILVFQELCLAGAESSQLENRTRVVDKRTGEMLLEETSETPIGRYYLARNREEGWVEVHCADRTFRFEYVSGPERGVQQDNR